MVALSPAARAQPVGKARDDAHKTGADRLGGHVEHAARVDVIEAFTADKQQGQPLLRRQATEKADGERVDRLSILAAEETRKARIVDLGLPHRVGVIAQLVEPKPVDLGEGPTIKRGAALIAVLLSEHALQRAAEKRRTGAPFPGQKVGKPLEARQHGNEPDPDGIVEILCLH